jgi:non-homologous end joining protein Ku
MLTTGQEKRRPADLRDIMEALKRSMKRVPAKRKTTVSAAKKRKNVS